MEIGYDWTYFPDGLVCVFSLFLGLSLFLLSFSLSLFTPISALLIISCVKWGRIPMQIFITLSCVQAVSQFYINDMTSIRPCGEIKLQEAHGKFLGYYFNNS